MCISLRLTNNIYELERVKHSQLLQVLVTGNLL